MRRLVVEQKGRQLTPGRFGICLLSLFLNVWVFLQTLLCLLNNHKQVALVLMSLQECLLLMAFVKTQGGKDVDLVFLRTKPKTLMLLYMKEQVLLKNNLVLLYLFLLMG